MRSLSLMIEAHIPVADALGSLLVTANGNWKSTLEAVRTDVVSGINLPDALARHGDIFPQQIVELVRVGTTTGRLADVLVRIAEMEEKRLEVRRNIRTALTYPCLVIAVTIVVTAFLLLSIVPRFTVLFESFGSVLPAPTRMVVATSDFLAAWWPVGLVVLVSGILLVIAAARNPRTSSYFDTAMLSVPWVSTTIKLALMERYCFAVGLCIDSGVAIDQALKLSCKSIANAAFQQAMHTATQSVVTGSTLAVAWSNTGYFSDFDLQLVRSGELSGNLACITNHIGKMYASQLESRTSSLASLIEPLLIIVTGAIVGAILTALYLPLFEIVNVIQ